MRGSVEYQVKQIWRQLDRIGQSKREYRRESGLKSEASGHRVSDGVHSYEYKDEILKTARQLGNFARENFGIKDMQAIGKEVIQSFVQQKIDAGVSYGTISNYISHLDKIQIGLTRIGVKIEAHKNLYDRKDLVVMRDYARDHAVRIERGPREYANPDRIVSNVKSYEARLAARLQKDIGLRASEAIRIRHEQIMYRDGVPHLMVRGKGGYELTKPIPADLHKDLHDYLSQHNGQLNISYDRYREELKEAVERSGEQWNGTHGMRHTYAHREYERIAKENPGMEREEILRQVSEQMGHHRPEITEVYLR